MKVKGNDLKLPGEQAGINEKNNLRGRRLYPARQDNYGKYQKERCKNPFDDLQEFFKSEDEENNFYSYLG